MKEAPDVPEDDVWVEPAPVGRLLRAARERRGLTITQVAEGIRVSPRNIQAIEAGRSEALPEGPYRRGFVEAYAAFIGVDPAEAVARLEEDRRREEEGRRIFRYPEEPRFNWRDWLLPIALAAVLGGFGLARLLAPRGEPASSHPPPPTPSVEVALPAPAVLTADAAGAEGAAVAEVASAPEGTSVRVLLRSEGTTWVLATADDGEERRHELQPGQNLELVARARLGLTLGDAGLVRVRSGERELGFVGERGETRRGMVFRAEAAPAAPPTAAPAGD